MITKIVLPVFFALIQIVQVGVNALATQYRTCQPRTCVFQTTVSPPITIVRTEKPCAYPRETNPASSGTKPRNLCSCANFKDYFLSGDSGCSTCMSNKRLLPPVPPRTSSKEINRVPQRPICPSPPIKTCKIQDKTINSRPYESGARNRGPCNSNVNLLTDMNREFSRRLCRSQTVVTSDEASLEKRFSCVKNKNNEFPTPSRMPSCQLFGGRRPSVCSRELTKIFERSTPKVPQPCSPCFSGKNHISNKPYRTRQNVECLAVAQGGLKVVPTQNCDDFRDQLQEQCEEFKKFLDSVELRSKLTAKTLNCQTF